MTLRELLIEKLLLGKTSSDIFPFAKENGYTGNYKTFKNYLSNLRKDIAASSITPKKLVEEVIVGDTPEDRKDNLEESLLKHLKREKTSKLIDICNKFDCAPNIIGHAIESLHNRGYEISSDGNHVFLSTRYVSNIPKKVEQLGTTDIAFGVASDLHFGSKCCQITALHEFCEVCRSKGIKNIFVPGDVVAGSNVYPGQMHDQYAISAEEQISSVLVNLPQGFEWWMLGGNHDYSFLSKGGGYNVINALANKRSDIHYVGFDTADIPILDGVDMTMIHPSGGIPYSFSYKLQKNIEQVAYGELSKMAYGYKEKPSVRFVLSGHLHIQVQAMFGSIFGAQCGCFEGQTNYLKRKGLFPTIGGYIIQACLGKNGMLRNFEAKFYIFDEEIDDYKQYSHTPSFEDKEEDVVKPIFE